jgi:hypothetical protein
MRGGKPSSEERRMNAGARSSPVLSVGILIILFSVAAFHPAAWAEEDCTVCHGRGKVTKVCPDCNGTGIASTYVIVGGLRAYDGCETCGGQRAGRRPFTPGSPGRKTIEVRCPACGGAGSAEAAEAIKEKRRVAAEQRELAEQREREEAEAARLREKEQADKILGTMRGISEKELGIKGLELRGLEGVKPVDSGAKPAGDPAQVAQLGTWLVDLRHLDPDRPITVDPNVVKGRQRQIPAQIDPETFKNENYNKGCDFLRKFDPDSAVPCFEAARKERPNDLLVRAHLLLARDLVLVRRKKEKEDKDRAEQCRLQALASLTNGDTGAAKAFIVRAKELNPKGKDVLALDGITARMGQDSSSEGRAGTAVAYRLVGHGISLISTGWLEEAAVVLKGASELAPKDQFVADVLAAAKARLASESEAEANERIMRAVLREEEAKVLLGSSDLRK